MSGSSLLQRGRERYAARDWLQAFALLTRVDEMDPLSADDLVDAGVAAYMAGRRQEFRRLLERAYKANLVRDHERSAARAAFWLGLEAASEGEGTQASAWLARAERNLAGEGDCVEKGYILLPRIPQLLSAGRVDEAVELAALAAEVARRFHDIDLEAFALHGHGLALLKRGELGPGLRMLDEALVAVTTEEAFPVLAGIVYCSAIAACRQVMDLRRMREWTRLLSAWCERQSGLVTYLGECKVFRSELLQLEGDWQSAIAEVEQALEVGKAKDDGRLLASAWYQLGELRRLRGEESESESAFKQAHRLGRDPQPGLAELWYLQGKAETASNALRRALSEARDPPRRIRLLPSLIRSLLALGEIDDARQACEELTSLAKALGRDPRAVSGDQSVAGRSSENLAEAVANLCTGEMLLASGEPERALAVLRLASEGFQALGARYDRARARIGIARACRDLGDLETGEMELASARAEFTSLAATADLTAVDRLFRSRETEPGRLSQRERHVLSLIAGGLTNREVAEQLAISARTVDRHVSNIFDKLGVSSRAAAAVEAVRLGIARVEGRSGSPGDSGVE